MKKIITFIYLIIFSSLYYVRAQSGEGDFPKNCPAYPTTNYFDPNCYMYLDEIQFGQGRIQADDYSAFWGLEPRDIYVPCNRPEWAIASMHGWQLMRNTLKGEYYDKHVFFATMMQESAFNCASDLDWSCYDLEYSLDKNDGTGPYTGTVQNDGCFHLSAPGYLWLKEYMPHRHQNTTHDKYVSGDNFERGVISKVHYDLLGVRFYEYTKGHAPLELFEKATDEFAADVWNARHFNMGYAATGIEEVLLTENRAAAIAKEDFIDAHPNYQYTYPYSIKRTSQVLANKYIGDSPNNEWHNWYDYDIDWNLMNSYMDTILVMYPELLSAEITIIKEKVQTAFNKQDTDRNGIVSFRYQFGPVLDAFILAMPYDDPMESILNNKSSYGGCSGCVGPVVKITANTPTKVCKGIKVELKTIIGTDYTYEWKRNDTIVINSNTSQHILYADKAGFYTVVVTNEKGCAIESECAIYVEIENCSNCDLIVDANITKNTCTDFKNGVIDLTLSGTSYNNVKTYTYKISGDTIVTQTNNSITGIKQGSYIVNVIDPDDAQCQAYTSVSFTEQVPFYYDMKLIKDSLDCNQFDVTAQVTGKSPSTCNYNFKVRAIGTLNWDKTKMECWGKTWDPEANPKVKINGFDVIRLEKLTNDMPNCSFADIDFSVSKGDKIELSILTTKQGSSINFNDSFEYVLTDATGSETVIPLGSYTSPAEHILHTTTASCEQPLSTFDFTWMPSTVSVDTDTSSKISVTQTETTTYKVKAIAKTDLTKKCPIEKEITLKNECCDDPVIDTSLQAVTVCEGEDATFTIKATGTTLSYEWYHETDKLSETSATLTLFKVSSMEAGDYYVKVIEGCGTEVRSSTVKLTVNNKVTPTIMITSSKTSICLGDEVNFSIDTQNHEGANPTYEWFIGNVSSETGTTFNSSVIQDGEKVTVQLTSDASCLSTNQVISNQIEIMHFVDKDCIVTKIVKGFSTNSKVIKAYNLQGKEISIDTKNELIIFLYENGEAKKVFFKD